jgi:hypothetical protein
LLQLPPPSPKPNFLCSSIKEGWFLDQFLIQYYLSKLFFKSFYLNKWFLQIVSFSFFDFVVLVRRCVGHCLVAALFCCPVLVQCLFGSNWQIRFDSVHIQQSMTLASSTLQTRKHRYFEHFKFVIFVGFVTLVCKHLPLYTINADVVILFADSLSSIFSDFELYYSMYSINLNEWIDIIFLVNKKNFTPSCIKKRKTLPLPWLKKIKKNCSPPEFEDTYPSINKKKVLKYYLWSAIYNDKFWKI